MTDVAAALNRIDEIIQRRDRGGLDSAQLRELHALAHGLSREERVELMDLTRQRLLARWDIPAKDRRWDGDLILRAGTHRLVVELVRKANMTT